MFPSQIPFKIFLLPHNYLGIIGFPNGNPLQKALGPQKESQASFHALLYRLAFELCEPYTWAPVHQDQR